MFTKNVRILTCGIALLLFTLSSGARAQRAKASNSADPGISYSSDLRTPRYAAGVTRGQDGRIYMIAGYGHGTHSPLNTVEVFDPLSRNRNWTVLKAKLNTPRYDLAATTGSDGKLYAIGGYGKGFDILSTVEVYDPASPNPQWTTLASTLNENRKGLAAVTGPDGRIYAIGGSGQSRALGTVEVYDPADTMPHWTTMSAALNFPRFDFAAVMGSDGTFYVIGGLGEGGQLLDTAETFNISGNRWSLLDARLDPMRSGFAAVAGRDGKIYLLGGDTRLDGCVSKIDVYNPANPGAGWQPLTSHLSTPRQRFAAVVGPQGNIFIIGGVDSEDHRVAFVEMYNPSAPGAQQIATAP